MLDQELILYIFISKKMKPLSCLSEYVQVMERVKEKQLAVDNLHRMYKMRGANPKREQQRYQRRALTKHAI